MNIGIRFIVLVTAFTLAGCAGAPVGWGGRAEVTMANRKAITIVYDPIVGGYGEAIKIATTHCQNEGLDAVPTNKNRVGVLTEQVFECR